MRRIVTSLILLAWPGMLAAGVYNTDERLNPLVASAGATPLEMADFRALRDDRRAPLAGKEGNDLKQLYQRKRQELEAKSFAGPLPVEEQISLSAYLIGLGDFQSAARLLEPAARREQRGNFMLLANLASAYFLAGQLDRATEYQAQLLASWPEQHAGFTPAQLRWLKSIEMKLYRLMLLRRKEQAERVTQDKAPDDIFQVPFVSTEKPYAPGKPPAGPKLPDDALATTQQLNLWLPGDNRLYWLLGEVLNAQGQEREALGVFNELIWSGYSVPELREHRNAIQASLPSAPPPEPPPLLTLSPRVIAVLAVTGLGVVYFVFLQVREMRRRKREVVSS